MNTTTCKNNKVFACMKLLMISVLNCMVSVLINVKKLMLQTFELCDKSGYFIYVLKTL